MTEAKGTRERVVAEAALLAGATYRVVCDEHGDYHTEYREGERARRDYRPSLDAALRRFVEAVREEEEEERGVTTRAGRCRRSPSGRR